MAIDGVANRLELLFTGERNGQQPGDRRISVADRRPHRDAWESEKILAYIEERAGTEFEPEAATAFVTMMKKIESGIQLSSMPAASDVAAAAPESGAIERKVDKV